MLKRYNMVIVVRPVFHKAKKYYPKVLLVYSMFIQISQKIMTTKSFDSIIMLRFDKTKVGNKKFR